MSNTRKRYNNNNDIKKLMSSLLAETVEAGEMSKLVCQRVVNKFDTHVIWER